MRIFGENPLYKNNLKVRENILVLREFPIIYSILVVVRYKTIIIVLLFFGNHHNKHEKIIPKTLREKIQYNITTPKQFSQNACLWLDIEMLQLIDQTQNFYQ